MNISSAKTITILVFTLLFTQGSSAQDNELYKKHFIGLYGPVSINSNLLTGGSVDCVYAIRYGYMLNKNISIGAEFSGYYIYPLVDNIKDAKSYGLRGGLFGRFTFFPEKRVNIFTEAQFYPAFSHFIPGSAPVFDTVTERKSFGLSAYFAPGLSIQSKNNRLSFDLMYKFADKSYKYGKEHGFSWRLNLHF